MLYIVQYTHVYICRYVIHMCGKGMSDIKVVLYIMCEYVLCTICMSKCGRREGDKQTRITTLPCKPRVLVLIKQQHKDAFLSVSQQLSCVPFVGGHRYIEGCHLPSAMGGNGRPLQAIIPACTKVSPLTQGNLSFP